MAEQPHVCEAGNLCTAHTLMANEAAAASGRRTSSADQLAADSQRMWTINMANPSFITAMGMQVALGAGPAHTAPQS